MRSKLSASSPSGRHTEPHSPACGSQAAVAEVPLPHRLQGTHWVQRCTLSAGWARGDESLPGVCAAISSPGACPEQPPCPDLERRGQYKRDESFTVLFLFLLYFIPQYCVVVAAAAAVVVKFEL